jgi:tRNA (cmo5U34)-methyltransferase
MHAGIAAYDQQARVEHYDRDMELMHPNRAKMADVLIRTLAASRLPIRLVVDLGTGTGFLLDKVLQRFPEARAIGIDGAASMLDLARSRLGPLADRVQFRTGDFREISRICTDLPQPPDAFVSSFALHHLDAREKAGAMRQVADLLPAGRWFLNADLVRQPHDLLEDLVQTMRVDGIVHRADGKDPRFKDERQTLDYLRRMEREEGDQPQPLEQDLEGLRQAGFQPVTVLWQETREVVFGGMRHGTLGLG